MSKPDDTEQQPVSPWEDPEFSLTRITEGYEPDPDRLALIKRARALMRPRQNVGDHDETLSD